MGRIIKFLIILSPAVIGGLYEYIKEYYDLPYTTCYLLSLIILIYWCVMGIYCSKNIKHSFLMTIGYNSVGILSFIIFCLNGFENNTVISYLSKYCEYFVYPMYVFTQYINLSFSIGSFSIDGSLSKYIIGLALMIIVFFFGCFIRKTFSKTHKFAKNVKKTNKR